VNIATKIRRLTHLITVLEKVELRDPTDPKLRVFDMGDWATPSWCGFAACALGEAGFDPVFRKAGLKTEAGVNGGAVYYDLDVGLYAGATFFGISHDESSSLFLPSKYRAAIVRPRHVIAKIQKLLARIASQPTHNQEP
jgi:hypothetical protein